MEGKPRSYRRWRSRIGVLGGIASLLLAACGGTPAGSTASNATPSASQAAAVSAAPTAKPDPVAGKSITVVYASDSVGINDFVTKLAWDSLAARGLKVNYSFVAQDTLGIQALIRGDAQVAGVTPPSLISAHQKDETLQFLSQYNRQGWSLAATKSITSVEQLAGKSLAVHSETSFTKTVADLVIKKYGLKDVREIIMPGSEIRAQALLSGKIDSTVLDIQDVINASHQAPGQINILVRFSQLYPQLTSVRWAATKPWIDANHDLALEIEKAMIVANRDAVANPDKVIAAARKQYPDRDPAIVAEIIHAFVDGNNWVLNGGMSQSNAMSELKFYFDAGQIKYEATAEHVQSLYRLDLVNEALAQLGKVKDLE